jgi:hypothetical protein
MKKSKILMLFLVILLITSLFVGCIPTIPTNSTNLEGEGKSSLNVEADVDPKSGTPPHEVQCVGFVSGGLIPYTYQWEFGDGSWSEKGIGIEYRDVFHTYLNSDNYTPILHVEDSKGKKGNCIAGVVTVGEKIIEFAGKQWMIDADESPGSNQYSLSIENIWLDDLDQLHFKMTRNKDTKKWYCMEIFSEQEGDWGYGKYEFEIEIVSDGKVDENVVIGLFTYDDEASEEYNREIDFEYSKWSIPIISNSQFVIQNGPDSIERFNIPLENYKAKISFDWQKEEIIFYYQCGDKENEIILPKNGEICKPPIPGNERVYVNLWLYNGRPYNKDKMEKVELVIKDFKFTKAANNLPEILSLTASPDSLNVGENSTITCDASDPDVGDILTYNWSAPDGGTISGSGSSVTWTAPGTANLYPVICTVSDGKGGSDEATVNIEVTDLLPDSTNKLFLQSGGALNGTSINPFNPVLTVNSGGSITGTLKVQAIYSGPSNNVVPFGYTPSWGPHSSSYVTVISDLPVGTNTYNVPINLNAPSTSGTYFLIFATSCEMNLGWTMSRTNWTTGTMSWNDGKDIADLTESNLDDSLSTGYLYLDMLLGSIYKKSTYGIAYVKIIVT